MKNDYKKSKKAVRLIETGQELFRKHGLRRVTVDEICRTADVSKMTFYQYFKNKQQLIQVMIKRMYDVIIPEIDAVMDSDETFYHKINRLFAMEKRFRDVIGEKIVEEYYDVFEMDDFIRQMIEEQLMFWQKFFEDAQKKGELRQDVRIELMMYMFENLRDWMNDPKLRTMYPDAVRLAAELKTILFYGILSRNDRESL